MQNTAFNSRAFRCPAFEPMFPLMGGVESAYAVGFDGTNDYISVPYAAAINQTSTLTVCGWVKLTSAGIAQSITNFVTRRNSVNCWQCMLDGGKPYITVWNSAGVSSTYVANTTQMLANVWYHVAFVANGSNLITYVNGNPCNNVVAYDGTIKGSSEGIGIGSDLSTTVGRFLNGSADDVRIYNRGLSAAEISSIYANTSSPPTSGLVAYFPLDEGTGTTTTDTVGGLVGTLTNGPTWQPQVCPRLRSNRDTTQSWSGSFDGAGDHGTISGVQYTGAFTLSGWFKLSAIAVKALWSNYRDSTGASFYIGQRASGQIDAYVYSDPNTQIGRFSLPASYETNRWFHLAVTYDGGLSASGVKIYVNGKDVSSTTTSAGSFTGISNPGLPTGIMCFWTGSGLPQYTSGGLAKDLRYYTSVLSDADIAKLANGVDPGVATTGHWKLDEGSGTTINDSSGNGYNGTLQNGATYSGDIPQWFRPAIESSYCVGPTDKVDDYVLIGNLSQVPGLYFPNGNFSISIWGKTSLYGTGHQALIGNSNASFDRYQYLINYQTAYFRIQIRSGASDSAIWLYNINKWGQTYGQAGTWFNLIASFGPNPTTNIVVYANGVAQVPDSTSISPTTVYPANNECGNVAIGARGSYILSSTLWGASSVGSPGWLDEVIFYDGVITSSEAADIAQGYLSRAKIISRYKLDGNANDSAGSNHGTEQGGVGYSTSVPGTL